MRKNQKVKHSLLELEKDFIELKDSELNDIKWPIIVSIDGVDKFEQKQMKKINQVKTLGMTG